MSRYDRLGEWLKTQEPPTVALSFERLESILGAPLPASARRHRPWWGNTMRAPHSAAWLRAGWVVSEIDVAEEQVEFEVGEHTARSSPGSASVPLILDGTEALERVVAAAGWTSLEAALAEHTVFIHPDTVHQLGGRAVAPVAREAAKRGQTGICRGQPVVFDDNAGPTDAFLWAAQRRKGPDVQFNHVWRCSDDPAAYTALWNICCTPAFLAKATDGHPECQQALRYRSWELYGCRPSDEPEPTRPAAYDTWEWAPMPPPLPDLEAVFRARLQAAPANRLAIAARTFGWAFSDGPDVSLL